MFGGVHNINVKGGGLDCTPPHTPNTFNANTTDHTFVAMVGKHHVGVDVALNKQVREAGHEWPWCRHLHHTLTRLLW